MGRHGGGSRSGGSSRSGGRSSRSGGGSRSSGSGTRTSSTPFKGCYNRSYYDRRGKFHQCYTSSKTFGAKSGWHGGVIFALVFITIHMLIMIGGFAISMIEFGGKVSGDSSRIFIEDNADVLTSAEEEEVLELLHNVYEASGMPVTLYTDDFTWKEHYSSLEVYSEELYYKLSFDEDAMVILFTTNNNSEFYEWEYDMYCGDDTVKCLSDANFDKLLSNFQKGMARQNLAEALDYSWNSVLDDLGHATINWVGAPMLILLLAFYGIFYVAILSGTKKQNEAYRYFKDNPEKLSQEPMTLYSVCPGCNASNETQSETCAYCGTLLKINDGNVTYVRPDM